MNCVTGKICYDNQQIAEQALIENRIRYFHAESSGPINVYKCLDCGSYHFTSKGAVSEVINKNKKYIDLNKEANYWENKLKK